MPETRTETRTKAKEEQHESRPTAGSDGPVCTVAFCPICLAVTAAQTAAPEAMDHLLKAAREFFLAARAVVDARAEDLDGSGGPTKLERVEIA